MPRTKLVSRTKKDRQNLRGAVLALAALSPRTGGERALETVLGAQPAPLIDAILLQGSCRRVVDRIEAADSEFAARLRTDEALQSRLTRIEKVSAGIDGALELLHDTGSALGITVYGVKGVASRRWYAKPETRELGDVDVMVRSAQEAWALTAALLDAGYDYDERELPWIKADVRDGTVYGQLNLRATPAGSRPNIDLHFGGYSVRHCARLPFPYREDEPGLAYYSREENLSLVVGNAAGDHWVSTKDLNDLWLSLQEDVDWQRVLKDLASVELLPFFGEMLRQLCDELVLDSRSQLLAEGLLSHCGREFPAVGTDKNWNRRLLATCRHAGAVGLRRSPREAARNVWTASRYYSRRMALEISDEAGPFRVGALDPRTCLLLVPTRLLAEHGAVPDRLVRHATAPRDLVAPAPELPDGWLRLLGSASGDVVQSARTYFVPTVYYGVGADHAAQALALAAAGAPGRSGTDGR